MEITEEELQRRLATMPKMRTAGPDDPIYKGGLIMTSVPGLQKSTGTSRKGTAGAKQASAPNAELPDPMQPAIDSIEEWGKEKFGDRYNPKA